jgi:hypothetical protein
MLVTAGWAVSVATMGVILGTPQVSRAEATISFSSRSDYFCWHPDAQGRSCRQPLSTKIWMSSPMSVDVE